MLAYYDAIRSYKPRIDAVDHLLHNEFDLAIYKPPHHVFFNDFSSEISEKLFKK